MKDSVQHGQRHLSSLCGGQHPPAR